jgi:hypothetical protein
VNNRAIAAIRKVDRRVAFDEIKERYLPGAYQGDETSEAYGGGYGCFPRHGH